jgi:hypothetical protein
MMMMILLAAMVLVYTYFDFESARSGEKNDSQEATSQSVLATPTKLLVRESFSSLSASSPALPKKPNPNDSQQQQHTQRARILSSCGDLCDMTRPIYEPTPYFGYFGQTTANIDCDALFETTLLEEPGDPIPPRTSPPEFKNDCTMNGRATVEDWYIKDVYLGTKAKQSVWTREEIDRWKNLALEGSFDTFGNYEVIDRSTLFDALRNVAKIQNQSVLVLGSEKPWVEAFCLAAGARQVTTLEYGAIQSYHPLVKTFTPSEFRQAYQNGSLERFDAVVSYSSIEHSGLGRYGDALNPFGDIMAIARAWCVTKPSGSLTLGVSSGPDKVYFNAGRIYGVHRWPYLATNWARVNYTSGWGQHPELWNNGPPLPGRLRGPPGHLIFRNQSSLVFRKTDIPGSEQELLDPSLLQIS